MACVFIVNKGCFHEKKKKYCLQLVIYIYIYIYIYKLKEAIGRTTSDDLKK